MHQNVETIKDNEILKIKICWKYELIIMAVHVDAKTSTIKMKVYVWVFLSSFNANTDIRFKF